MRGTLRVITTPSSKMAHRLIELWQAPSPLMLKDVVRGDLKIVEGFDTILHEGEARPCIVFCNNEPNPDSPNAFANLLWLQALVRKKGFAGVDPTIASSITGPVAVLYGDQEFLEALSLSCDDTLPLLKTSLAN